MSKFRLDQLLAERGLVPTRARARDAILRGMVTVDGEVCTKPSRKLDINTALKLDDPAAGYVSRAALKLLKALDLFGFDPAGRICVDIGASTGGFCQVLLERGAAHVYGVDVGHDQLHESLRTEKRLTSLEGINARALERHHVPEPFTSLVSDVSFISLKLALPPALVMAEAGSFAAFLVKPQFEVGREHIGKGGLVRHEAVGTRAAEAIADWLDGDTPACSGWRALGLHPSPILGGDGNREYLLGAIKEG